jgi:ATP-dependent Lon protease
LKTVILPEKNLKDLIDLPKTAKAELKIIPVKHLDDVLKIALSSEVVSEPPRPKKLKSDEGEEESNS